MNSDIGIDFFAREYNQEDWKDYCRCFGEVDIPKELLDVLPQDVLRPLVFLLGDDYGINYTFLKDKIFILRKKYDLEKNK